MGQHVATPGDQTVTAAAFEEALPFTALLVVFFAIVAVIEHQGLFSPVIEWVMTYDGKSQQALFYLANEIGRASCRERV